MVEIVGRSDCESVVEKVFEVLPDAAVMIDSGARIVLFNVVACRMFGYSFEEAVGNDIHRLVAPEELHSCCRKGFDSYRRSGEGAAIGRKIELCGVRKGGERFPVELSLTSLRMKDGLWGAIGIVRDISERNKREKETVEMQEKLLRMEVTESIGKIVSGVMHDFNNLLTSVLGLASLMKDYPNIPEKIREYATKIMQATEKSANLSRSLLRTMKGADEFSPVCINEIVDEVYSIMLSDAHNKKITVRKELQPMPLILGNYYQLVSVFLNIFVNAMQAMENSVIKELRITTEEVFLERSDRYSGGRFIKLCISDTGCGITDEIKGRIFESFFTTKKDGSGIGLPLASSFVRRHGGHLELISEAGRGTQFYIYLPCVR
jgi:PAS domain S-box-containing protein